MIELAPAPITPEAFAPYGDLIDLARAEQFPINQGLTTRFHDLFKIDTNDEGGRAIVNVFRTNALPLPHRVRIMERHPLGSQAFFPLDGMPFFILVADASDAPRAEHLKLFFTAAGQAVNLHKNTWHHFQIVTGARRDFLVIDRGGNGKNLEEVEMQEEVVIPESAVKALARNESS